MTKLSIINIKCILDMLPHRYPFLLIDKVIDITLDQDAIGIKNVTMNEPQFTGHFPKEPIMPGVLIVESMAQTAAILVVQTLGSAVNGKLIYFMSINNAKFRKPVIPGDVMYIHVIKKQRHGLVWKMHAQVKVNSHIVAEATFTAMIRDNDQIT